MLMKMQIVLKDDTALKFRKTAYEKFGYQRGSLSKAAEEAISEWVKKNER